MPSIEAARNWYPASDPVHGFDHVLRVYRMAERLAVAESADLEIVRAAALLHDVQENLSSLDTLQDQRHNHHQASADFAANVLHSEGWQDGKIAAVIHCIRAHRFRDESEQPKTIEAKILFDADKLDAIGAIGVGRGIGYAVQHGQPVYAKPSDLFLKSGQTAPGEAHSSYHEYVYKLCRLKDRLYTPSARLLAISRHQFLVQYYEQLVLEMEDATTPDDNGI